MREKKEGVSVIIQSQRERESVSHKLRHKKADDNSPSNINHRAPYNRDDLLKIIENAILALMEISSQI